MKRLFLILAIAFTYGSSFSQVYKEFSLPHTTDIEVLNQYIGQRVKVPSNYGGDFHDGYRFDESSYFAEENTIYTITKFKCNKKYITLFLKDIQGNSFKVNVNANKSKNHDAMTSCESFFLVDKFNNEVNRQKSLANEGKHLIYNKSGDAVASIYDVYVKEPGKYDKGLPEFIYKVNDLRTKNKFEHNNLKEINEAYRRVGEPILNSAGDTVAIIIGSKSLSKRLSPYYYIQNKYDGNTFVGMLDNVRNQALRIGEVFTHPQVIHSYKIVGFLDDKKYTIINTLDNTKSYHEISSIDSKSLFREDLSGKYVSVLKKVEKPSNSLTRYGKMVEDVENTTLISYVDKVIDILIVGGEDKFSFVLKNISDNSIKIIWDEAVFVNFDGSSSKVMHSGIKYSQRESHQPATVIIKGAKLEDVVIPTCNIRYSTILEEWVEDSMYPSKPNQEPGELRLMIPIQIKDVINEYTFVFDVKYLYNHPERLKL